MGFKAPNDAVVHRLEKWGGTRWPEDEWNIAQVENWRMRWTIVKKKGCFSTFSSKLLVILAESFLKYLTINAEFFCALY